MSEPLVQQESAAEVAPVGTSESTETETSTSTSEPQFLDSNVVYAQLPDVWRDSKLLDDVINDANRRHQTALSEIQQKYADFEGLNPQEVGMALGVFRMLSDEATARQVYDAIGGQFNFSPQQIQQIQQEVEQQEEEEELSPELKEIRDLKARIDSYEQKFGGVENYFQQQVQQEFDKKVGAELDAALKEVYTLDSTLAQDQIRHEDLVDRIYFVQSQNGNRPMKEIVVDAFNQQRRYNQNFYDRLQSSQQPSAANRQAPLMMAPSGSNPGGNQQKSPHDMNEDERKAALTEMLIRANAQG